MTFCWKLFIQFSSSNYMYSVRKCIGYTYSSLSPLTPLRQVHYIASLVFTPFVYSLNKRFVQWNKKTMLLGAAMFWRGFHYIKTLSVKNSYLGCLYCGVVTAQDARTFFFSAILLLAFFAADFRRIILSPSCNDERRTSRKQRVAVRARTSATRAQLLRVI